MAQYKVSIEIQEIHELTVEAGSPSEAFLVAISRSHLGGKSLKSAKNRWISFDLLSGKPLQIFNSWSHWATKFSPLENHIKHNFFNVLMGHSGKAYDAYGVIEATNSAAIFQSSPKEQDFLNELEETQIWTFYENEDIFQLANGYLDSLDALGYLVTEQPWSPGSDYRVLLGEIRDCPECSPPELLQCEFCRGSGEWTEIYP
jgi:hypothetical protein